VIRAVLDTNTIVSAVIVPVGIPAQILAAARAGQLSIITSPPIVTEVLRTLQRDRIRRKYGLTVVEIEGTRLQIDSYVHDRLALFLNKKARRSGRSWKTRYTRAFFQPLGVYRLSGTVAWRAATPTANR
jgi:predicted nucleic acid-binding protein